MKISGFKHQFGALLSKPVSVLMGKDKSLVNSYLIYYILLMFEKVAVKNVKEVRKGRRKRKKALRLVNIKLVYKNIS